MILFGLEEYIWLDMKFVRENPEKVMQAVANRNGHLDLTEFLALDKQRRESDAAGRGFEKRSVTALLRLSAS